MADIFISYASEDRPFAESLATALETHGWSVWWDTRLLAGKIWDIEIEKELHAARCVVVLWSSASRESRWVKEEATHGLERGVLVPACIDDAGPPFGFRHVQAEKLDDWTGDRTHAGLARLMDAIRACLDASKQSAPPEGDASLAADTADHPHPPADAADTADHPHPPADAADHPDHPHPPADAADHPDHPHPPADAADHPDHPHSPADAGPSLSREQERGSDGAGSPSRDQESGSDGASSHYRDQEMASNNTNSLSGDQEGGSDGASSRYRDQEMGSDDISLLSRDQERSSDGVGSLSPRRGGEEPGRQWRHVSPRRGGVRVDKPVEPSEPDESIEEGDRASRPKKPILRYGLASVVAAIVIVTIVFLVDRQVTVKYFEAFRDCEVCPEMVALPGGTFTIGSPPDEKGRRESEGPQREVTIEPFAIGKNEVTLEEWDACVEAGGCNGHRPDDAGWGRGRRPVIDVSWDDAQAYVAWLSEKTGQSYRLLSEAEWEFAARAGTTTRFAFGDEITSKDANFSQNVGKTTEVGSYPANAWGLHDMHGNVREWVEDHWYKSYAGAPADGSARVGDEGKNSSAVRVIRGGSWGINPGFLRSASRYGDQPDHQYNFLGFRVARTLD